MRKGHSSRNARHALTKGFTLVELIVCIAIIVLIAAIAIPVVSQVLASSRDTQCLSNLRQMATAVNLYRNEHVGLPPLPLNVVKASYENRSVWEYGDIKAVGLGCLQYEGYLDTPHDGIAVLGDNRSLVFNCPARDSGNGWAYSNANWIDYSYLLTGDRYRAAPGPELAVATDVSGGIAQKVGVPSHGDDANVAYADGSVDKIPYSVYSEYDRSAAGFDRTISNE